MRRRLRKNRGQSLTEIAIIVALVGVAAIGGKCPGQMHHYFLMAGTGAHRGHRTLKDFGYSGAGSFYGGGICFSGP